MFSFNREKVNASASSAIVWTWVAFTSFYTLYSLFFPVLQSSKIQAAQQVGYAQGANAVNQEAMQSFSGNVFQNGYTKAYGEIGQALFAQYKDGCKQAIPLNVGGSGAIGIVSIDCLAQAQSGATQAPATSVQK